MHEIDALLVMRNRGVCVTQAVWDTDRKACRETFFPGARFHLIAERQTSTRADGDVEI